MISARLTYGGGRFSDRYLEAAQRAHHDKSISTLLPKRKKDEDPTEAQLAMQTDASTAFRIP